jgi:hypothetical protein
MLRASRRPEIFSYRAGEGNRTRTISLGTGLSCVADHSICTSETIYLVRECPLQIVPSGTQRACLRRRTSLRRSFQVGTMAVAGSLQVIYERIFGQQHRGWRDVLRFVTWAGVLFGSWSPRPSSANLCTLRTAQSAQGLVTYAGTAAFFWWTMHFMLAGRVPWCRLIDAAVLTALLWIHPADVVHRHRRGHCARGRGRRDLGPAERPPNRGNQGRIIRPGGTTDPARPHREQGAHVISSGSLRRSASPRPTAAPPPST